MFLQNKYLPEKRSFEVKYASFKNTSNFQGANIRPMVPRHQLYCLYCVPLNFLARASSKVILNYFNFFR